MRKIFFCTILLNCLTVFAEAVSSFSGIVRDGNGKPLSGIRISDGFKVVRTDASGKFEILRNPKTRTLSVVVPKDRETDCFYHPVKADRKGGYDFVLRSRPVRTRFSFIQFSDHENNGKFIEFLKHVKSRALAEKCAFIASTGDLCREYGIRQHAIDMKKENFGGIKVVLTCGNHDLIQQNGKGEFFFEDHCGPTRYAFEEGNVLFLILPMRWGDRSPSYTLQEIAGFTKSMLDTYPKDQQVFILTHDAYPWLGRQDVMFSPVKGHQIPMQRRRILGLTHGHTHWYDVWNGPHTRVWSTGQSRCGGGGNAPGAMRIFRFEPDGTITTELVESNVKPVAGFCCDAPSGTATVTAFSTNAAVREVTGTVNGEKVRFSRRNGWLWIGSFRPAPGKDISHEVTVLFQDGTGKRLSGKTENRQKGLRLERMFVLPGRPLFGKPLVVGNTVYSCMTDECEGKKGGLCAFDAKRGKLLWKTITGYSVRNTPILADGKLYVSDAWNNVYVLDAKTGKRLADWSDPDPEGFFDDNWYGGAAMGDGKLFTGCGQSFRAIDLKTGRILWRTKHRDVFGTVMPYVYRDGKVYSGINWGFLNCFDGKTGKRLWTTKAPKKPFHFQPTFTFLKDGTIFYDHGRGPLEIVDPETGKILRSGDPKVYGGSTASVPLEYNGKIYFGTHQEGLACFDWKTLKKLWTTEKLVRGSILSTVQYRPGMKAMESSPVQMNGKIAAVTGDGVLRLLDPETGKQTESFDFVAPVLTTPVFAHGKLYVTDYTGRLFVLAL